MRKLFITVITLGIIFTHLLAQGGKDLKVIISVDMEGVTGVVNWEDVSRSGKDYDYFRKIMTEETNAAIEGAAAGGATEILVRDSHGSARNILPDLLDERARLIRDWSGGPLSMMEGIDQTYDAVIFIGYHAKAGTDDSPLAHTMSSSKIADLSINGVSLPEAGFNALIAGYYNVPVVFLAGGRAICDQVKDMFGEIETVAVKKGIGRANESLHPKIAQKMIQEGVKKALSNLKKYKPYKLKPPFTLVLSLKKVENLSKGVTYPGVKQTGKLELTYKSNNLMDLFKAFEKML